VSPGSMPRPTTMNFSEAVAISASSLWAHKLRSDLTLIGVVIGVLAVIAVVSLINGANQAIDTLSPALNISEASEPAVMIL
jgi:ABC-type lipoprotein release transport system permease subunit